MRRPSKRARIALVTLGLLGLLDAARSAGIRLLLARPAERPTARAPAARPPAPPDAADPVVARGRYLVESGLCGHCHTPTRADGTPDGRLALAGGVRFVAWPFGVYVSGNLSSDPETGLGRFRESEIAAAIRTGHTPERALDPVVMPSVLFSTFREDDARAIARYLMSRPPVRNAAPPPLRYGFAETLAGKLLFFGGVIALRQVVPDGNFGRPAVGAAAAERTLGLLPWMQLAVLAAGLAAGWRARPPRAGAGRFGGLGGAAAAAAVAVALAAAWLVTRFPALPFVSAEKLREEMFSEAAVTRVGRPAADAKRVRRGRYVYFTRGCAVCHGMDGAERIRLSWTGFGTTHTANLTPHPTGLLERSDAEIERALRAGRAGDGRPIHWRAMPWTRFGRLGPDDMGALIAYLRALPPVACPRPAPLAPAPGDPADLTATFRVASECRR